MSCFARAASLLFAQMLATIIADGVAAHGAVDQARATAIPDCTQFVDAAVGDGGEGTAKSPHATIDAALAAAEPGGVICVAEGTYADQLKPGTKHFTLAGGFQSGEGFKVRDSAAYVSKVQGSGGSFIIVENEGPSGDQRTVVDGFEITGFSRAIVRDFYESQRFDVTNNYIHDNTCADASLVGAGVALNNVSGSIKGNVFENNACGRGGALFLNDSKNENSVSIENNRVVGNSGTEPGASHGGALYLFGNTLTITGNFIADNSVTQWGGGLYVGAFTPGNQPTTATLSHNVYRGNRAGNAGGGFFCDDGATCTASHEIYDGNCGGNILVDGGSRGSGPTTTRFDHITSVGALTPACDAPGDGLFVDTYEGVAPDSHTVTNAIFWDNASERDVAVACGSGCDDLKVGVSHSMVQTKYQDGSVKIAFGAGNVAPSDPRFVAPDKGDFKLQDGSPVIGRASDGSNLGADVASDAVLPKSGEAAVEDRALPPRSTSPSRRVPSGDATPETPAASASEASAGDVSAKQAFSDAKELGTREAWSAFLDSYPRGFYANLARAYIKKLDAR